ncbi:MAG: tRNA uridine-5-carboxymethylaminomethyl(34) synthesis GTPase MnmE [Acidobacteria bacterium]|nr:tRNA uridine-5-carboxymethylaminomethyl(34) synthesis GTPase MnmE [Acidobacteriota bacterium]
MKPLEDTICALSSAPGSAAIAVVRLSGPDCFPIVEKVFMPACGGERARARYAALGKVIDPRTGTELDQALVTCFPSPHSYTGEDVAEISLHGSAVIIHAVLGILCECGARLAEPGEFTMRAFLRGKMDLAQAEAVRDTIEAFTLYQAQVAGRQRSGALSSELQPLKRSLLDIIVQLETAVEFEDDGLVLDSRAVTAEKLVSLVRELDRWVGSYRYGRIVREGFSLAVIGRPNVGKSSVFNALLEQDRSIVTESPGTTRDLVTEEISIRGIPVRLIDTAGVGPAADEAERLGVERSYTAIAEADAILLVVDSSRARSAGDEALRDKIADLRFIVVFNKCDLKPAWSAGEKAAYAAGMPWLDVSALTGERIDELRGAILTCLFGGSRPRSEGILVTNLRHLRCLEAAREAVVRGGAALRSGVSEEYVLVELHESLARLGEITGETNVQDILDEIFSRFCIGK